MTLRIPHALLLLALLALTGCPNLDDDDSAVVDDDDVVEDDDDVLDDDDVVDDDDSAVVDDDDSVAPDDDDVVDDDDSGAVDADGDGVPASEDCDDSDPNNFPGNPDLCDFQDNDCDGVVDEDAPDSDLDGFTSCDIPPDCNDFDPNLYPEDLDGDGFTPCEGDCLDDPADPLAPYVFPGSTDTCDGFWDTDCDGFTDSLEIDADGDGSSTCTGDCDDADPAVNTTDADGDGSSTCNGDCNDADPAISNIDGDGDGFTTCMVPPDCDDADPTLYPDDLDFDGVTPCDGDCDDSDSANFPGNPEFCDGFDNDCDGLLSPDELDGDGDGETACDGDCAPVDPTIHTSAVEVCDGVDQDCDGLVDDGACDALELDGDDRVTIPTDPGLDMSAALTIEVWFMFTEDPYAWTHGRAYLLDRLGSYRLWYSPGGTGNSIADQFFFDLWDWQGSFTTEEAWQTGVWYHLAGSWDGATSNLYLDGVLQDTDSVSKTLPAVAGDVHLGSGDGGSYFTGLIDEVRLWSVARSEEEIRSAVCALDGVEPGLAAVWSFDEGSGQDIFDGSAGGLDGFLGTSTTVEGSDPARVDDDPECFDLEWCDGLDNDGDGLVDEEDSLVGAPLWWLDGDSDGYGDPLSTPIMGCVAPAGRVHNDDDCDDSDPAISPLGVEAYNAADDDCDGWTDEHGVTSLLFDGADDGVWIDDDPLLDITGPITMEAWVYATAPGGDEPIIAKEHSSGQQQYWFGVYYDGFGLLIGDGSGWGLMARSSGAVPTGSWIHLASVWDGSAWFNYADGVLVEQGTWGGTPPVTSHPLTLGVNSTYDFTRFAGNLTDVRLWSVARTPAQVAGEMWGVADTTGLVGHWNLDDATGQTATDDSGNALHGRLGSSASPDGRDPTWSDELPEQP